MTKTATKAPGFISICKITVLQRDYWQASFFRQRPTGVGLEIADKVLVESNSRSATSYDACVAKAQRAKPDAVLVELATR